MSVIIGEKKTRFYSGEKFVFERVAKGEWKCNTHEYGYLPSSIKIEIETWD